MPQQLLETVAFPHPGERGVVQGFVGYVVAPYLRQIVLAWRAGYAAAGDPSADQYSGPGARTPINFRSPIIRAYRDGFRRRRLEQLGQAWGARQRA